MDIKIKFAIYTSFYNCSRYVDQIFENILSIEYEDWKWFITDDFSSDGTEELIKEKIGKNNRIEYVNQSRKKEMYWQPNIFIPSEYEYILLVCSDDKVDPKILSVYDSVIRKNQKGVSVLTCDLQEIYEEDNSLKSIGYVINQKNIIQKLDSHYLNIDYINNLGYYAFGLGMCFKNYPDLIFEINDFSASSEDFYRMLYMSSFGKWVHVPRNLYTWTSRRDSESRKKIDPGFYGNFQIALDKCKESIHDPIYDYNICYKELNSLMVEKDINKFLSISIISPWISEDQKSKIREIYPEKNLHFNKYSGSDLYAIVSNYSYEGDSLIRILNDIKENNSRGRIIVYHLDENIYYSNEEVSEGCVRSYDNLKSKINEVFSSYYFFTYFRHVNFIIEI